MDVDSSEPGSDTDPFVIRSSELQTQPIQPPFDKLRGTKNDEDSFDLDTGFGKYSIVLEINVIQ
jgi:hypothetical protein